MATTRRPRGPSHGPPPSPLHSTNVPFGVRARRQAEADLAQEQLARMEDQLKAVVARQQGVIEETKRLEELRESQGRLTRGQKSSVTQLSGEQSAVQDETKQRKKKNPVERMRLRWAAAQSPLISLSLDVVTKRL